MVEVEQLIACYLKNCMEGEEVKSTIAWTRALQIHLNPCLI